MAESLEVIVDLGKCCGYSVCAEICPEVFDLDDNGFVAVKMPVVPSELADLASQAAAACPQSAIALRATESAASES